jgi:hypothetical protein
MWASGRSSWAAGAGAASVLIRGGWMDGGGEDEATRNDKL